MAQTGMENVSERLASFNAVHRPISKGRTSGTKAKSFTWPHARPSPKELAQAGFYFHPTEISPDNTACFLCRYALDGWEEDDDPITEHLRHSSECGWAITMDIARRSSNPNEIVDPTSDEIAEARRATFGSWWPHDGKKGWKCKMEKMVEAGWYFCPAEESDDFVSCAYCNLSLDGWEPKDDPFDEHYRRSTECSFFHFALAAGKKGKSGRKNSRSSKASRISTQSNISTLSETVTPDLENEMDYSLLSQATSEPPNTSTKPKAKGRKAKAKKETPAENSVLVEGEELAEVAEAAPVKKPRGRKRKSDEILEHDTLQGNISSDHEPAPKRRPTASRKICTATAVVITDSTNDTLDDTVESTKTKKQPKRKPAKKRSTSTNRGSSNTAKALKSQIPNDAEIEAQLEADLERDEEVAQTASPVVSSKPSRNAKRTSRASEANEPDEHATAISKKSGRKTEKKSSKKKVSIENDVEVTLDRSNPDNEHSENDASMGLDHAEEKIQGDPEIQPTANTHNPPKPSKKSKTSNQRTSHERNASTEKGDSVGTLVNRGSSNPNKTIRRSQTIFDEITISRASIKLDGPRQSAATQGQVVSLDRGVSGDVEAKGRRSRTGSHPHLANEDIFSQESTPSPVKPRTQPQPRALPQAQERTPSPSPQSSDAENRPPSARPPLNPNEASSIKSAGIGLPQSPKTPAASVQRGFGETIISTPSAWNPVDLDDLLQSDYANKENVDFNDMLQAAKCDLTSPEKRMTVEEWIAWNAKKGETKLRNECEKLVSVFEREGGRAMQVLEEIECID